jgi:hypothetical protein
VKTKQQMLDDLHAIGFHLHYPDTFQGMSDMSEDKLRPWYDSFWAAISDGIEHLTKEHPEYLSEKSN